MNHKKLNSTLLMGIMLVSTLAAITIPTGASESDIVTVRGYLYIDDDGIVSPASEGIDVILSFDSGDETDYTNVNGYYQFDFPSESYIAETGYYTVYYYGMEYIPLDEYNNRATVDIEDGYIYFLNIQITVVNSPPVADPGGPYTSKVGDTISFDGSSSYDLDGTIETWSWDFDDGNTGNGETTTHSFGTAGTYTVTLTVTDDEGAIHNDTTTVVISTSSSSGGGGGSSGGGGGSSGGGGGGTTTPTDLVVDAGETYYGVVNKEITITGSATGGTPPYIFEWDLNNDGYYDDGIDENLTYSWSTPRQHTIKLKVTDNDDKINTDEATVIVSLLNNPPYNLIIDGITEGKINTVYDFTATVEDDDTDDVIKYGWDWDNDDVVDEWTEFNTPDTTVTINHIFTSAGFYIVKAHAEDDNHENSGWSNALLVFIDVNYYLGDNGKYYIDIDKDDTPDQVYDPELGTHTDYKPEDTESATGDNETPKEQGIIIWYILGIIILLSLIGVVFFGIKNKEKPKKKSVDKKKP